MKKNIPWLMLAITLAVAAIRAQPPQTQPLPENILVVRSDSLQGLVGARALFPLRGGIKGETWAIEDVLATGSRSPVGERAPRIQIAQTDPTLKTNSPTLVLSWHEGERFGTACLTQTTGLLTSPSTRFTPGLVAATDIAATMEGRAFSAGRPAVLVPGNFTQLEVHRAIWERKSELLRFLVLAPWLFSLALLFAAWRGKSLGNPHVFGGMALVFWADLLLGSPLLERLPFSYSVTEAARFYGIGNDAAGFLIGCALAAGFEAPALLAVALAIGVPSLGANNGCFLAALVGIAAQAVGKLPVKKRLMAAFVALLGISLLFLGLAHWDASRGVGVQTHLGQAVSGERVGVIMLIGRKLAMNGHLLVSSPWSLLLLTSGILLARRRAGGDLIAGGAALALNDSGVLAAATLLFPLAAQKAQSPPPQSEAEG
ncbi:hypothetical protein [Armatimonas sp.]|uniref:hypothetical protein n=1 Tax=Armatimonas sp. TaxID=1872638 RepID=UPI00374FE999